MYRCVVFITNEQEITPYSFGMRRNSGDALKDCALEIQLEHHAEGARESRIQTHREVQGEHVPGLQQIFQRFERSGLAGFRRRRVSTSGRAKRPVHRRVLVEQRQEHDDAFGDR